MSTRKQKLCLCLSFTVGTIAIMLAILGPSFVDKEIKKQALDKSLMTKDNFDLWGLIPGDSGTTIEKRFYLMNFTNPFEFLHENKKPEMIMIGQYNYQQFQNFTNIEFGQDQNKKQTVKYRYWEFYKKAHNLDEDIKINTLNFGALGVWSQAKNIHDENVVVTALYSLITGLEEDLYPSVLAQVVYTILKDQEQTEKLVFDSCKLKKETMHLLWEDTTYGWKDPQTFMLWIKAQKQGITSGASYILRDHFSLQDDEILCILQGTFQSLIKAADDIIAAYYGCDKSKLTCDPRYLAYLQWTSQGVTNNPPGGAEPIPSVASINSSISGFPEISYFKKQYFLKFVNDSAGYMNVEFTMQQAARLFAYSNDSAKPLKRADTLLHISNLKLILDTLEGFNQIKKTNYNLQHFEQIRAQFQLVSLEQAHLLCEYIKYMLNEFTLFKSEGGEKTFASMATFFTRGIYVNFAKLKEYLLPHYTTLTLQSNIEENSINCETLMGNSLIYDQQTTVKQLCEKSPLKNWDYELFHTLINVCWYPSGIAWKYFRNVTGLNENQIQQICSLKNQNGFGPLLQSANNELKSFYGCSSSQFKCTKEEFAIKQWSQSLITNTLTPTLKNKLNTTLSVSEQNKEIFPEPFEFQHFLIKFDKILENKNMSKASLDQQTAKNLLNFDSLFNSIKLIKLFIAEKNKNETEMSNILKISSPQYFLYYIRHIILDVFLGGFTKTMSVRDILLGYEDPLLKNLKQQHPLTGGDPSIDSVVELCIVNSTYEDAQNDIREVYTGLGDKSALRSFYTLQNLDFVTIQDAYFNGNETVTYQKNPWAAEIPPVGTDSLAFQPLLEPGQILGVYSQEIAQSIYFKVDKTITKKKGLDLYNIKLVDSIMQPKKKNATNSAFYMVKWANVFNLTTVKKLPIFVSQPYFKSSDQTLYESSIIYNDSSKTQQVNWDQSREAYILAEKFSGGTIDANVPNQINYEYQQDQLFVSSQYSMIPIYQVDLAGYWNDDRIDVIYKELQTGVKAKSIVFYGGLIVGQILFFGAFILCLFLRNKQQKDKKNVSLPLLEKQDTSQEKTLSTFVQIDNKEVTQQ